MKKYKWVVPNNDSRYSLDVSSSHGNTKMHLFDDGGLSICKRWAVDIRLLEPQDYLYGSKGICTTCDEYYQKNKENLGGRHEKKNSRSMSNM